MARHRYPLFPISSSFISESVKKAPIHDAIASDDKGRVLDILKQDSKQANHQDDHGNSPLIYTLLYDSSEEIKEALLEHGALPEVCNNDGQTYSELAFLKEKDPERFSSLASYYFYPDLFAGEEYELGPSSHHRRF